MGKRVDKACKIVEMGYSAGSMKVAAGNAQTKQDEEGIVKREVATWLGEGSRVESMAREIAREVKKRRWRKELFAWPCGIHKAIGKSVSRVRHLPTLTIFMESGRRSGGMLNGRVDG